MDFKKRTIAFVNEILSDEELRSFPIDLDKIALKLGIILQPFEFSDDISGLLTIDEQLRPKIGYNTSENRERQRFTIAHEIGHYILHSNSQKGIFVDKMMFRKNINFYNKNEESMEVEANYFAANLLMPKALILKAVSQIDPNLDDDDNISNLAKDFGVSKTAMTYRLINLKLFRSLD